MEFTPEEIERFQEQIDAYASTKGRRKMWNYFQAIAKTDYFVNKIKTLRKDCEIPENGFECPSESWPLPPTGFNRKHHTKLHSGLEEICKKYSLHYLDWFGAIEMYLFYNKLEDPIHNTNAGDLCYIADLVLEKEDPFGKNTQENDDLSYPLAIRVSPYASQRDIIDFVKKTYKFGIKELQNKYKAKEVKIGKIKSKKSDIQARNEFIYENRNLPRRKIMEMVLEKFGNKLAVDYGYIGKIISLEKKRRKEL